MKAIKNQHADSVVLTLRGDFDAYVVVPFLEEISKIENQGIHKVVVNMRLVKFVNSSALGAMIRARRELQTGEGDLLVSSPSPAVLEAMEALGIDQLFTIHTDDDSALDAIVD